MKGARDGKAAGSGGVRRTGREAALVTVRRVLLCIMRPAMCYRDEGSGGDEGAAGGSYRHPCGGVLVQKCMMAWGVEMTCLITPVHTLGLLTRAGRRRLGACRCTEAFAAQLFWPCRPVTVAPLLQAVTRQHGRLSWYRYIPAASRGPCEARYHLWCWGGYPVVSTRGRLACTVPAPLVPPTAFVIQLLETC